jgi:hypothetical protein
VVYLKMKYEDWRWGLRTMCGGIVFLVTRNKNITIFIIFVKLLNLLLYSW